MLKIIKKESIIHFLSGSGQFPYLILRKILRIFTSKLSPLNNPTKVKSVTNKQASLNMEIITDENN